MRERKIHLFKNDGTLVALCGKVTWDYTTEDPEIISCKSCSGMYRTNMEWYSNVRNKHLESKDATGSGDIYTRQDVEAVLMRLVFREHAIESILDDTKIFRNVSMKSSTNNKVGLLVQ